MLSDESSSIWGAWNGNELTDEQIDMMVREAEAKQRQEKLRQHLLDEGQAALAEKPRPWWKPEGPEGTLVPDPRLSHVPSITSITSSVPTLLMHGGEVSRMSSNQVPLTQGEEGTGASSSNQPMLVQGQSDPEVSTIQGISMLQPYEGQNVGPTTRSSGERPHSIGAFTTPHNKKPRWSLGSDGGNVSLQSPDRVMDMRESKDPTTSTPPSAKRPVNTPGKWLWSPKSIARSLPPLPGPPTPPVSVQGGTPPMTGGRAGTPPCDFPEYTSSRLGVVRQEFSGGTPPLTPPLTPPGEPGSSAALARAQAARPRSMGATSAMSTVSPAVGTDGHRSTLMVQQPPTPPTSYRQHRGTTPPPTPPNLIRGNNGQQVVVPPLWRTPPSSARISGPVQR